MGWLRRNSDVEQELRDANAELGDQVQDLRRQLSDAVQQAANTDRSNEQLAAANEQLAVQLSRYNVLLSKCNEARLRDQAQAANDLRVLEGRNRRAMVILADPNPNLAPSELIETALRVLEGGESGG